MKTSSVLFLLAVTLPLAFVAVGRNAHAAPVASPAPAVASAPAPSANTDCLRRCLREFKQNLRSNKKACWICTHSFLGVCLAGHHNEDCIERLYDLAEEVHEACVNDCSPPTPTPPPGKNP